MRVGDQHGLCALLGLRKISDCIEKVGEVELELLLVLTLGWFLLDGELDRF